MSSSSYDGEIRRAKGRLRRMFGRASSLSEEYRPLLDIWLLRLVLTAKPNLDDLEQERVLKAVGLSMLKRYKLTAPTAVQALAAKLSCLEAEPLQQEGRLHRNMRRLTDRLHLTKAEQQILAFAVMVASQGPLKVCAESVPIDSPSTAADVLAQVLGLEREEVRHALRKDGILRSTGLLSGDQTGPDTLADTLDLLHGTECCFLEEHEDLDKMFTKYFRLAPTPRLTLDDFPYLQEEAVLIRGLLGGALQRGTQGVNVLLYGDPGTGKTEFVRAMAAACGVALFEVSFEPEQERIRQGSQDQERFRAYRLSQRLLGQNRGCLILFDEVEDVFPDEVPPFFGVIGQTSKGKALMNHVLETNPVPTFWLSNHVWHIDPAYRRRFDYTLELRTPPQSVRRKMLGKYLADIPLRPEWMAALAACDHLAPAHIQQLAKVAGLLGENDGPTMERLLTGVIRNNLETLGYAPRLHSELPARPTRYNLDLLNPSEPLAPILAGLQRRPAGRACLYGPPGSGKTAFAHHLAEQLDKPLLKKQASDILSPFVGITERNIARMFREAQSEKAVLLLDEADSFLQDRRGARASWEVTQVNELLVQMETFEGVFICSTNLMESLDQAVLRRFDFKLRFDYLRPAQSWTLFLQTLEQLGAPLPAPAAEAALHERLANLRTLTPGDFAVAVRQVWIRGGPFDAEAIVAALAAECDAKARGRTRVDGFTASERGG